MSGILAGIAIAETFKWIWDSFGKDIVKSSTKTSAQSLWGKVELHQAAKRYAEDMEQQYGKMSILSMAAPISLEYDYQVFSMG